MTRGRPRGPLRDMLCRALEQQPGTVRQVAGRTQLAYKVAAWMLRDMVDSGEACRGDAVRVDGVKRPVPVYSLAAGALAASVESAVPFDNPQADQAALDLQRIWSKWWPDAEQLAAAVVHVECTTHHDTDIRRGLCLGEADGED